MGRATAEPFWVWLQSSPKGGEDIPGIGSGFRKVEAIVPRSPRGKWVRVRPALGWEWSRISLDKWKRLRPVPARPGMRIKEALGRRA